MDEINEIVVVFKSDAFFEELWRHMERDRFGVGESAAYVGSLRKWRCVAV